MDAVMLRAVALLRRTLNDYRLQSYYAVALSAHAASAGACKYEVWVADQADTNNGTALIGYGGYVHIYSSEDLAKAPEIVDLGAETSALCFRETGAYPVRPHMLLFNTAGSHAVIAFVASGHVAILRAKDRKPVACFRTTVGAGGARQAHAAYPSKDNRYIVVANQNGKKVERINVNWKTETFVHDANATLAMYGNCTTPSGALCEDPVLRPDNAPICTATLADPPVAFVNLRGGGLFVVDYSTTPVRIVAEYDNATIGSNGCGGLQAGKHMYINSGGGTSSKLYGFKVYKLPVKGYRPSRRPNTPRAKLVADDPGERDAHYAAVLRDTKGPKYFWQPDRYGNNIDVFDIKTDKRVGRIDLEGTGLAEDPTPDALVVSPVQDYAFVTLRGSIPLSADPHVSRGSSPGLGVLDIQRGGTAAVFTTLLPISNIVNGENRADPHGMDLRIVPGGSNSKKCSSLVTHTHGGKDGAGGKGKGKGKGGKKKL